MEQTDQNARQVPVWDAGIRLFHWTLAALVFFCLIQGFFGLRSLFGVHVWAGYGIALLIGFRVIWGVFGSTFARFSSFRPSLAAVMAHLRGHAAPAYGHNPLGALMVFALLLVLSGLVATGIAGLGGTEYEGPLAAIVSVDAGFAARMLHEGLAILLALMVAAHVGGVIFESRREHENLVRAMVTGRKRARADATPRNAARIVPALLAAGIVAACVAAILSALAALPQARAPIAAIDPLWAAECSACHTAHHPALMSAARWQALMAALDDHFGEDASLDATSTEKITAWLAANAAETTDAKAAMLFSEIDPAEPLRITATPGWKALHHDIPDAVFAAPPVGTRANCALCHADAQAGTFRIDAIAIPAPTKKETP